MTDRLWTHDEAEASTGGRSTARGQPDSASRRIAAGSSVRGLSSVSHTRSAWRQAASAMSGRLARSRSPPQPKTTITRPPVTALAARSRLSSEWGVWA